MNLLDFYYQIKPLIPRRIQIALRRTLAAYKRRVYKDVWPVHPEAAQKPRGWNGWPDQKKFAVVLNHDVDTFEGLKNCTKLMDIEKQLGFRSTFNFVIEDYPTPPALRKRLTESGFEVGIHGVRHDGKTFLNNETFFSRATQINHYLIKWEAEGFTSPSMLRNLSLMSELDIKHGCSTFDTDPFEPHAEGMKIIFPFFVMNNAKTKVYVELPYTLPQDHGLFIILKEKDNTIWKKKLDWLVENGGMVLLNSHPDYMNFDASALFFEKYPVGYYTDFLEYIKRKYEGQYWNPLSREMARFWNKSMPIEGSLLEQKGKGIDFPGNIRSTPLAPNLRPRRIKVWIDLDNTPHVPFFRPIISALEQQGHQVVLSARDAFQVCELANKWGISYAKIGRHYGKNPIMKIVGLIWRSMQLLPFCLRQRPGLALSHGARSQILVCNLLRIPTVELTDYEHARHIPLGGPRWMIVPESLFGYNFSIKSRRLRFYRGIKEDVYVSEFMPDSSLVDGLGLSRDVTIITVRPPANEAHYYNPKSDVLFEKFMSRVCQTPGILAVLLPRNHKQEETLRAAHPDWFMNAKTIIPPSVLDGLNLLWFSDLVVSGGGTMNREAAAMGVPVYSIFRGKTGGVDRGLEREGRLILIRNADEIWNKIALVRRDKTLQLFSQPQPALKDIMENIEDIIRIERIGSKNRRNPAMSDG